MTEERLSRLKPVGVDGLESKLATARLQVGASMTEDRLTSDAAELESREELRRLPLEVRRQVAARSPYWSQLTWCDRLALVRDSVEAEAEAVENGGSRRQLSRASSAPPGAVRQQPDERAPAVRPAAAAVARVPTRWRCDTANGFVIGIRTMPAIDGPMSGDSLRLGETFLVSQELSGSDGVLYLRLADGRGWVFDQKPGVGTMCVPEEVVPLTPPRAPADSPVPELQGLGLEPSPDKGPDHSTAEAHPPAADNSGGGSGGGSGGAVGQAGADREEGFLPPPLFNLEIRIRADRPPECLVVREGDRAADVAAEFAARHLLAPPLAQRLYDLLEQQLRQPRDEAGSGVEEA